MDNRMQTAKDHSDVTQCMFHQKANLQATGEEGQIELAQQKLN